MLSQMKGKAGLVIPAIVEVMDDPSFGQMDRMNAIGSLGKFGPAAMSAVPKLSPAR